MKTILSSDELGEAVLDYLVKHRKIDTTKAAKINMNYCSDDGLNVDRVEITMEQPCK